MHVITRKRLQEFGRKYPDCRAALDSWPIFSVPQTEADYNRLTATLDHLIDEVGEDESHPLASLMDTLGTLIEAYEDIHIPEPEVQPGDMLKFLLEAHGLAADDVPELGPRKEVRAILAGKNPLEPEQILKLCLRFHVHPSVFVNDNNRSSKL